MFIIVTEPVLLKFALYKEINRLTFSSIRDAITII
jgi:hypothetical protein